MAIEYTLFVATELSPIELCGAVREMGDVAFRPLSGSSLSFSCEGLNGFASILDDAVRAFVKDDLGIVPGVRVLFRLDKFALEKAERSMVKCIAAILRSCPDDMVLLFGGELRVLSRYAGELVLEEGSVLWTPENIALLSL